MAWAPLPSLACSPQPSLTGAGVGTGTRMLVGRAKGAAVSLGAAPEPVPAWPPQGGDLYIREQRTVEEGGDPGECQQVGGSTCVPRPLPSCSQCLAMA